jgi:hypothetical protein
MAAKVFKVFLGELRSAFPEAQFSDFSDSDVTSFEEKITPLVLRILKKDSTIFDEEFMLFNVNISPLYQKNPTVFWKHIQGCSIAAFLGGDIKEKLGKLTDSLKGLWGDAGHNTDEIEKILGTEESRSKISDILEFIMSTRIAKVIMSLTDLIDLSDLGIDFENPEELMKNFQNIESNPMMEKIMKKVQDVLKDKIRKGEFTKEMLARDIEAIKVKVQTAFGDMFTEALGGRKAAVPSQVILGNSPEARRARMVARLQRKVEERKPRE